MNNHEYKSWQMEPIAAVHRISTTASFTTRFVYGEGLGRSAAAVSADPLI